MNKLRFTERYVLFYPDHSLNCMLSRLRKAEKNSSPVFNDCCKSNHELRVRVAMSKVSEITGITSPFFNTAHILLVNTLKYSFMHHWSLHWLWKQRVITGENANNIILNKRVQVLGPPWWIYFLHTQKMKSAHTIKNTKCQMSQQMYSSLTTFHI